MTGLYEDFWVEYPTLSSGEVKKLVNEIMLPVLETNMFVYNKRHNVFYRICNNEMINVFSYRYSERFCGPYFWEPCFSAVPLCAFDFMGWSLFKSHSDYARFVTEYEPHAKSKNIIEKRDYAAFSPCIIRRTFEECVQYVRHILETYAFPLADSVDTWEKYTQCILQNKEYGFPLKVDPHTKLFLIGCYAEEHDWLEYSDSYRKWFEGGFKPEQSYYQKMASWLETVSDCRRNRNLSKLEQVLKETAQANLLVLENEHRYPKLREKNSFISPEAIQAMQYFCTHSTLSAEDLIATAPEKLKDELRMNVSKIKF